MRAPSIKQSVRGLTIAALAALACSTGEPGSAPEASAEASPEHGSDAKTVTGGEPFHGLLEYRAKDAKLALVRPVLVPADAAPLASGVSVVGVSAGGESRAYPLYILKNHQIVNDRVGGQPIAASW